MKSESFKYQSGIDIPGFQISIMPNEMVKEGNPIMLMHPKDYERFREDSKLWNFIPSKVTLTEKDIYGQTQDK